MSNQNYHVGHVKAASLCPLCGKEIIRTCRTSMETGNELVYGVGRSVVGVASTRAPTIEIEWMCESGCQITLEGIYRSNLQVVEAQEVKIDSSEPKLESLTGESLRKLSPKAERAKHALDELGEGINNDTKGKGRSGID